MDTPHQIRQKVIALVGLDYYAANADVSDAGRLLSLESAVIAWAGANPQSVAVADLTRTNNKILAQLADAETELADAQTRIVELSKIDPKVVEAESFKRGKDSALAELKDEIDKAATMKAVSMFTSTMQAAPVGQKKDEAVTPPSSASAAADFDPIEAVAAIYSKQLGVK
jgi:hypothetical protein